MFQTEVDKSKNLLTISYTQHVGPEEMQSCARQVQVLLAGLQPGFRLLTDLSGLETMDFACVPYIKQIMDILNQQGVEQVMRVIPDPRKDIGLNIMSLFHYRRGVRIVTCGNLEEAMQVLAS